MMNAPSAVPYDLAIIGGGINGTGIARDAAGRGLKVLLLERDDLAAHTSSWSTKLIHGGLRYLEYYEFRLVSEALAEREVLLAAAPHLISPLQFVLPHEPHLRPAWMIRAGLFLYDRLGGRTRLPRSFAVDLATSKWGAGLKESLRKGFVYSDARVDDARLVVANAIDARDKGADIRPRTEVTRARRDAGLWRVTLRLNDGSVSEVTARALINAGGPWVKHVQQDLCDVPTSAGVRHIKGSHIVVPRIHPEEHAYILQNSDHRIVFVIPYQGAFSLIGTTDIAVDSYADPSISADEIAYLCDIANAYLASKLSPADVVWTYSGVRPLYDDGAVDPAAVTRDYVLKLERGASGNAPLLSIFGGKITTYRRLSEQALGELAPYFPDMKPAWTKRASLPGGDLPQGGVAVYHRQLAQRYARLDATYLLAMVQRHGSRCDRILGDAARVADLGTFFGGTLYSREVDYLRTHEWAVSADDILWRRTKCGLNMNTEQRDAVTRYILARDP
jgi:glycerol-3-phosphate dehydrogenase